MPRYLGADAMVAASGVPEVLVGKVRATLERSQWEFAAGAAATEYAKAKTVIRSGANFIFKVGKERCELNERAGGNESGGKLTKAASC